MKIYEGKLISKDTRIGIVVARLQRVYQLQSFLAEQSTHLKDMMSMRVPLMWHGFREHLRSRL